jgi:hypothetical protein
VVKKYPGNYAGTCRGGPHDGYEYVCHRKSFYVAINDKPSSVFSDYKDSLPPSTPTFKTGVYNFVLGQWIWRGPSDKRNTV